VKSISDIFIYSDQPTTCPNCGSRSEVILEISQTKHQTQIHKCINKKCKNEFIMQYDEDFNNGDLL